MVKIEILGYEPQVIHYVHPQSPNPNAIPLIIVHGWPGSFLETRKIIEPLTKAQNENDQAFVIAPSIPGYGPGRTSEERLQPHEGSAHVHDPYGRCAGL